MTRLHFMAGLLAGASFIATSAAWAQGTQRPEGFYIGGEAGLTIAESSEVLATTAGGFTGDDEKDISPMFAALVGYDKGAWRLEASARFRWNDYESISVTNPGFTGLLNGPAPLSGSINSRNFGLTAMYNVATLDDWRLYAGVGADIVQMKFDDMVLDNRLTLLDETEWTVAAHVGAQLVRPVGENMEFGFGYRYYLMADGTPRSAFGVADYGLEGHDIYARLTWHFGGNGRKAKTPAPRAAAPAPAASPAPAAATPAPRPAPTPTPAVAESAPAPAPTPAPAPEPEPAPLPGPFMVFFDFDSATISPNARRVIQAAARAYKDGRDIQIEATGHTDRSGSTRYNQGLSERRVRAVQAALVRAGVAEADIDLTAKGESDPLVDTADGVREPQNRRVEIVLER